MVVISHGQVKENNKNCLFYWIIKYSSHWKTGMTLVVVLRRTEQKNQNVLAGGETVTRSIEQDIERNS